MKCLTALSTPAITSPGALATVDTTTKADVLVVEGGTAVVKVSNAFALVTPFASGTQGLGAIAFHTATATLFGVTPSGVISTTGNVFSQLAVDPSSTRCIGIDDTAVYWTLADGTIVKHFH